MVLEVAVHRPHRAAHRRDELMDGAHRLQFAERFALFDRIADIGQLDRNDLTDRVLSLIGDANLRPLGLSTHPKMVVAEAQYRDGIGLPLLPFLLRHRALLTKARFNVSSLLTTAGGRAGRGYIDPRPHVGMAAAGRYSDCIAMSLNRARGAFTVRP